MKKLKEILIGVTVLTLIIIATVFAPAPKIGSNAPMAKMAMGAGW